MLRSTIIAIAVPAVTTIAFYAGVFSTSFNSNACYSAVIHQLEQRTQTVAASKDPAAIERYAKMMQALPLHGNESDCDAITAALKRAQS